MLGAFLHALYWTLVPLAWAGDWLTEKLIEQFDWSEQKAMAVAGGSVILGTLILIQLLQVVVAVAVAGARAFGIDLNAHPSIVMVIQIDSSCFNCCIALLQ